LEHPLEVELLLGIAPEGDPALLTDDRHNRLVIHFRVVEAIEEVHCARPGRRYAHPDLPGELRMGARHERRDLLMRRANIREVLTLGLPPLQGTIEAADPVPGVAVEPVQVPLDQSIDHDITDCRAHGLDPSYRDDFSELVRAHWRCYAVAYRGPRLQSEAAIDPVREQRPRRTTSPRCARGR